MPNLFSASPPTFLNRLGLTSTRPQGVVRSTCLDGIIPSSRESTDLSDGTEQRYIDSNAEINEWKELTGVPVTVVGRLKK